MSAPASPRNDAEMACAIAEELALSRQRKAKREESTAKWLASATREQLASRARLEEVLREMGQCPPMDSTPDGWLAADLRDADAETPLNAKVVGEMLDNLWWEWRHMVLVRLRESNGAGEDEG